jgi:NADPH-dependent 7-cyano-7-deazaguanine reductase QueF
MAWCHKHRWHADAGFGVRRVGDSKCKERYLQPFRSISRELPEDCPHEIGEAVAQFVTRVRVTVGSAPTAS